MISCSYGTPLFSMCSFCMVLEKVVTLLLVNKRISKCKEYQNSKKKQKTNTKATTTTKNRKQNLF